MKKLTLLIFSIIAWACFVNAQPIKKNNGQAFRTMNDSAFQKKPMNGNQFSNGKFKQGFFEKRKMGMFAGLHLSPDQMKQGKVINEDFRNQKLALEKNDKISLGEYKTKLASLKKDRKEKLLALLNDKQKNQIAEHKKNAVINAQVKNVARLERMKLTLGLSEDQVAKIKSHQSNLREKLKAIRENDALLPDQKKEEVKNLMAQRKDFIKTVLTPEQQIKADSLKKNFKGRWNMNNRPMAK
jgi:hypothetical protein